MTTIQLFVDIGGKRHSILMDQGAGVDDIFETISRKIMKARNWEKMQLYSKGEPLRHGRGKTLNDCELTHLSELMILVSVSGGISPKLMLGDIKERTRTLDPLPGYITITTSPSEPDMIFPDEPDERRAKMPCGHVIGPSSMTSYCQSLISNGMFKFYCPSVDQDGKANCNREWPYFLVRHVACLSDEEIQDVEKNISDNYLKKAEGMQQCPGCTVWCLKRPEIGDYVQCSMCKKEFCWACLNDWTASSRKGFCGNRNCDGLVHRKKILETCSIKKIEDCKACPSKRSCPNCSALIEHKTGCGHMKCYSCSHEFCFICLQSKKKFFSWPCSAAGTCPVAPLQDIIAENNLATNKSSGWCIIS